MLTRWTLLDLECVALPDARDYLPKIEAPGNYTKKESIDAYVQAETMRALDRAALDADTCCIVSFGIQNNNHTEPLILLAEDAAEEARRLEFVWTYVNAQMPFVGYGLTWYDLGVLVRRSQILGVMIPDGFYRAARNKYRHDWAVELADYVTLNGMIAQKNGRGLDYHCRRLGINVPDSHTGKEIAALWKADDLDGIVEHATADMARIRLLATRLGVIPSSPQPAYIEVTPGKEMVF